MNEVLSKKLITTLLVFIGYMFYSTVFVNISLLCGLGSGVEIYFAADILFLFAIIMIYRKNLRTDYECFKTELTFKNKILKVIKYILLIFLAVCLYGLFSNAIFPNMVSDENSESIVSLFQLSSIYVLFKTLIFASIAEELVFKESLRDIINNKIAFVIISSLIYATMNIMYNNVPFQYLLLNALPYFLVSAILGIAYVKNNNNIFLIILIKFCYNLIPTLLLILGAF